MQPRILELRQAVLSKNDELARDLRARFRENGVLAVNLVSSPGSGKTALLEATLREMRARGWAVAAIVGDLATENDALRLARSGAPVRQIETGTLVDGAALVVERVPVQIFCPACDDVRELAPPFAFRCPVCAAPVSTLRQGREIQLAAIEIEEAAYAATHS